MHLHLIGILGSGMAPIAILAKEMGFEVTGCDISNNTYYSNTLNKSGIEVKKGHDVSHIKDVDIVAVSPAVFDLNPNHPEIVEAKNRGILMTWQEFAGRYLHSDKYVIAISGTHGKSTTTLLTGQIMENARLDPIVEAGAIYKPWSGGLRVGNSEYFVCEADEFNDNFLNYHPNLIVINNIEMDHPEYFKDFNQVKETFKNFIMNMKGSKILIVNEESTGVRELLNDLYDYIKSNQIKLIGYYIKEKFAYEFDYECKAWNIDFKQLSSDFGVSIDSKDYTFHLSLPGIHNILNALGTICIAYEIGINMEIVKETLNNFEGVNRRCEKIEEIDGIQIYDDYAHHPTAIRETLNSFKLSMPDRKVWAIFEPHQISRMNLLYDDYAKALDLADKIVVTKTYVGREALKDIVSINMNEFVEMIGNEKAVYLEQFVDVVEYVINRITCGDIVIVFGAGESYKLTRNIVKRLRELTNVASREIP